MRFAWDSDKADANLKKHGISFEESVTVFFDPFSATLPDPDHSIAEERLITVGLSARGRLLVVCHADRGRGVRIISARRATAGERKRHES